MSYDWKCSECDYYSRHLDFDHDTCLEHRPCLTWGGYEPALCEACDFNRGLWDPISHQLTLWRHGITMLSHGVGGAVLYLAFVGIVGVLLHSICY